MANTKKANHGKPPMATNSKNKNKSEEEVTALDFILNDLSDLGLGSEGDI